MKNTTSIIVSTKIKNGIVARETQVRCPSAQRACAVPGYGAVCGEGRADSSAGRAGADATRAPLIDTTTRRAC